MCIAIFTVQYHTPCLIKPSGAYTTIATSASACRCGCSHSGSAAVAAIPAHLVPCAGTSVDPVDFSVDCSVFDPGSNPNIDRQGSNYYDTVKVRCTAAAQRCMLKCTSSSGIGQKQHRSA
jgi:hypothetical protein